MEPAGLIPSGESPRFRPGSQRDLAPSTPRERLTANVAVLELLAQLDEENRLPSAQEQGVLVRWSGWG